MLSKSSNDLKGISALARDFNFDETYSNLRKRKSSVTNKRKI